MPSDEGAVTVNNVKLTYTDSDLQNREVAFAMSQEQRDLLLQGECCMVLLDQIGFIYFLFWCFFLSVSDLKTALSKMEELSK